MIGSPLKVDKEKHLRNSPVKVSKNPLKISPMKSPAKKTRTVAMTVNESPEVALANISWGKK